jgi:hypothetical protein
MRAAQDAPLAEMLTAYRVGVAEIWDTLVATARGLPDVPAAALIDLAGTVFAAQNTYSEPCGRSPTRCGCRWTARSSW